MNFLKMFFAALAIIVMPAISFAMPLEERCASMTARQMQKMKLQVAVWEKYAELSIKSGDVSEAVGALAYANTAAYRSCQGNSKHYEQLDRALALLRNKTDMLVAAKLIAKHEYGEARKLLLTIKYRERDRGRVEPEGHSVLLKTANDGFVSDYFFRLDTDYADGVITRDGFEFYESGMCLGMKNRSDFTQLIRCNKYK